jgi:hypothetical protein
MSRKERMSVSLEPSEKHVLERIAKVRGVSASSVLRELVTASYEPLSKLAAILEAAEHAQASYRQGLRQTLELASDDVESYYQQALEALGVVEDSVKGRKH